MDDHQQPNWHGYFFALLLFLVTSGQIFALNYYFNRMMIFGLRIRTQLIAAIYRKSLKLSNSSRSKFTTGQIVNLMAVDAQRFVDVSSFINLLWSAPLQIIIAMILLWRELGLYSRSAEEVLPGLLIYPPDYCHRCIGFRWFFLHVSNDTY